MSDHSAAPLHGVKVLDFTGGMAGPDCSMLLADFGAEVIKVESPAGATERSWGTNRFDGESGLFLSLNRNKSSVTLDLKSEEGQHAVRALLAECDVVMESYTPGVADRIGIGYESARELRPDVIYCSISGFGQTGPLSKRPGYDQLLQAYAGHMSVTGEPDRPSVRVGPSAIDLLTGAHAALGIVLAVRERDRSGQGQYLETSLYDTSLHLMTHFIADHTGSGKLPVKSGGSFAFLAPYGMYNASDREFYMGVGSDRMFASLCAELGRLDLVEHPDYSHNGARIDHRAELDAELNPVFSQQPAEHWLEVCTRLGIPCSIVHNVSEVVQQEQAAAREMIVDTGVQGVRSVGVPIKLSRTPGTIRRRPPALGEDNTRILGGLAAQTAGRTEQ